MRAHFQLCSKVLGLFLVTAAILAAFTMPPFCIVYIIILPRAGPYTALVTLIVLTYVLAVLVPALLGLYLTRSDNVFVRRCYPAPHETAAGKAPGGAPEAGASPGGRAGDDERRYAPPGYEG